VQPLAEIGSIARRHGVLFHSDAAQAAGRIDLDVRRDGIDLLSLSAHKVYGPKGVGALYVRRSPRTVPITRQIHGGGQERGMRAGTLNVPGIVGFGVAAALAREELPREVPRLEELCDRLLARLERELPELRLHGSRTRRVAGSLNVSFGAIAGDTLLSAVPGLALSGGAACSSAKAEASHVLTALGVEPAEANRAVRIALGRGTTADDVARAGDQLVAAVCRLRGSAR
jgi:cysteine desulfurase